PPPAAAPGCRPVPAPAHRPGRGALRWCGRSRRASGPSGVAAGRGPRPVPPRAFRARARLPRPWSPAPRPGRPSAPSPPRRRCRRRRSGSRRGRRRRSARTAPRTGASAPRTARACRPGSPGPAGPVPAAGAGCGRCVRPGARTTRTPPPRHGRSCAPGCAHAVRRGGSTRPAAGWSSWRRRLDGLRARRGRGWRGAVNIATPRSPVPVPPARPQLPSASMSSHSLPERRFGQELLATVTLALPLVLGHVSTGLIGFVDNVIAGRHGTQTLASVTVGTALLWLPMMVPIGTLIALTASVSQLDGSNRRDAIAPLFRQALWLALGLGLLMFAFLTLAPLGLARFGIAPEIVPGAIAFAHAIRWGVPALILFFCMRYLSEGLHWTLPTMVLGFAGLGVLAPLGYALTFGVGPLPEL